MLNAFQCPPLLQQHLWKRAGKVKSYKRNIDHEDPGSYVQILDTTLRDGEQSPGVALTFPRKLEIAHQLAKLKVDIIDAGFPSSSTQDAQAVKEIAKSVGSKEGEDGYVPVICALSRCVKADIDAAWEAVHYAKRPRILTFISTSEIHMKHKLNKSPEEVIAIASETVAYARSLGCADVQFGAEDAGRSKMEMLYEIFEKVIKAGASTVGVGDTVGYLFPSEVEEMTKKIRANTLGIQEVVLSWHCHNDLGLATINTLSAAMAGARQLDVTINGIGERAGNASMEEVVMAMRCRHDMMKGLRTGIDTTHIFKTSQMVSDYTGMTIQPHKAIVGANAFSHESGIHQDGVLKHRGTYEILSPGDIGHEENSDNGIILGKHSGRHALNSRLEKVVGDFLLGHKLETDALDQMLKLVKEMAYEKKHVPGISERFDELIDIGFGEDLHLPSPAIQAILASMLDSPEVLKAIVAKEHKIWDGGL